MFPDNRLSTTLVASPYTYPYNLTPPNKQTAYSYGGSNISDPSQGLEFQLWTAYVEGDLVMLDAPNQSTPIILMTLPAVREISLAFDQNMNPALAFVQYGTTRLYWFDTFTGEYTITDYSTAISPRITLDDRRELQSASSDIIFSYILNNNLYFRLQRERYLTEHLLKEDVNARIERMGMNTRNRLQWQLKPIKVQ
jgi:hypothetical protein